MYAPTHLFPTHTCVGKDISEEHAMGHVFGYTGNTPVSSSLPAIVMTRMCTVLLSWQAHFLRWIIITSNIPSHLLPSPLLFLPSCMYVCMYVAANDVSSRDLQKHHSQWFKGKTLDRLPPSLPTLPSLPSLLSSHRTYTFIIYNSLKRTSLSCLTHPRIYYVQSLISTPPLPSPTATIFPPPVLSPLLFPPDPVP